ncbi:MAG: hypothetical protein IJI14_03785 [Anaerolineaceae bacterium]|nr:hypothetical protein [Anaerolineaceae bacterium]
MESKYMNYKLLELIIIVGMVYALYLIMRDFKHENNKIKKEDNISRFLLSLSSVFTIVSSTIGSGTVVKLAKMLYSEYKWLVILTFLLNVFGFLFSAAALIINENEYKSKVPWEQTEVVLKRKILFNRISIGTFFAAVTIVLVMILLRWG